MALLLIHETDKFRIYEPVSIPLQYFRWVGNIIFDWNWGLSTRVAANVPVFDVLTARMAVTLKLNFLALFFYIPIGYYSIAFFEVNFGSKDNAAFFTGFGDVDVLFFVF